MNSPWSMAGQQQYGQFGQQQFGQAMNPFLMLSLLPYLAQVLGSQNGRFGQFGQWSGDQLGSVLGGQGLGQGLGQGVSQAKPAEAPKVRGMGLHRQTPAQGLGQGLSQGLSQGLGQGYTGSYSNVDPTNVPGGIDLNYRGPVNAQGVAESAGGSGPFDFRNPAPLTPHNLDTMSPWMRGLFGWPAGQGGNQGGRGGNVAGRGMQL